MPYLLSLTENFETLLHFKICYTKLFINVQVAGFWYKFENFMV